MFAERVVNVSYCCGVLCSFNIGEQRSLLLFAIQNFIVFRDWSKSIGGGGGWWAGAFGNVVDKKHMTHPLPSAQK